jgi:hypothetical protein
MSPQHRKSYDRIVILANRPHYALLYRLNALRSQISKDFEAFTAETRDAG